MRFLRASLYDTSLLRLRRARYMRRGSREKVEGEESNILMRVRLVTWMCVSLAPGLL